MICLYMQIKVHNPPGQDNAFPQAVSPTLSRNSMVRLKHCSFPISLFLLHMGVVYSL